jgi:ketosteroid isomerase-like protein
VSCTFLGVVGAVDELGAVIERYHRSLDAFMRGDHEPARALFSERDDVTLGNPFGPFARGFEQVVETMARAAAHYRDGEAVGFDAISSYVGPELACIVEVERLRSKVGGADELAPLALRVTTLFRKEDGQWRIVHRHADPITTERSADSVLGET